MNSQQEQFLNLKLHQARLKVEETAWYLGFSPHEIPILIAESLLKPLGRRPTTGTKYFAFAALEELRKDMKWLSRASDCIVEYWRSRNEKKNTAYREEIPDTPSEIKRFQIATWIAAASLRSCSEGWSGIIFSRFCHSSKAGKRTWAFFEYACEAALLLWPRFTIAKRSGYPAALARSAHAYRYECKVTPSMSSP
jgi:hypothetical protein